MQGIEPAPQPKDTYVPFKRRTPAQSEINTDHIDLGNIFDHIRMLDADGYPRAFLDVGNYRFEITRPALRTGSIHADVRITRRPTE
jgi:methionyl-tRNA formyltransferase